MRWTRCGPNAGRCFYTPPPNEPVFCAPWLTQRQNWCKITARNPVEKMRKIRRMILALTLFATMPTGAVAAPVQWQALVIGQSWAGGGTAFADAYHASRALSDGGVGVVQMLRDAPMSQVAAGLEAMAGAERLLIYYAGPMAGGHLALRDGDIPLAGLLADLAAGGTAEIALLIEDCSAPGGVPTGLDVPEGAALFVAASAGPDGVCPDAALRLTDRLSNGVAAATAPINVQELLSDIWTTSTLTEPPMLVAAPKPIRRDTTQIVSVVANDMVSLTPMSTNTSLAPVVQASGLIGAGTKPEAVAIFSAPASSQIVAMPRAAGLPEPSIIVGVIEGLTNAAFQREAEQGDVSSAEISYDNLVARQKLRGENPELFESLVVAGAFDPPEPLLGRALQSELARMGCYNATIDGVWGGGSRASVQRYFDEVDGENAVTLEPASGLFRQIISKDDIVCKAPVAVAAPVRAAPARGQTSGRAPQAAQPRRTPPVAAPTPRAPQGQIKSGTTMGVFR